MGLLNLTPPTIGQPNATEDVDTVNAFSAIQTLVNGNIDSANIKDASLSALDMALAATGLGMGSFRAHRNAASSLATGAVVPFDTDTGTGWDLSNWLDTATNVGRFTPQVAGYYRFDASVYLAGTGTGSNFMAVSLYKNGSSYAELGAFTGGVTIMRASGTTIASANGTTEFFEIVLNHNLAGAQALTTGPNATWFGGELIGRA